MIGGKGSPVVVVWWWASTGAFLGGVVGVVFVAHMVGAKCWALTRGDTVRWTQKFE